MTQNKKRNKRIKQMRQIRQTSAQTTSAAQKHLGQPQAISPVNIYIYVWHTYVYTPWKFNVDYIDAVLDTKNDGLENVSPFKTEYFGYLVVKFRGVVDLCDVVNCGKKKLVEQMAYFKIHHEKIESFQS